MKKRICIVLLTITVLLVFCSCSSGGEKTVYYTVKFDLNGGVLVSGEPEQKVKKGSSAVAPMVENGNNTLSWDKDYSNIMEDMVVTAVWTGPKYTVRFDVNGGELVSGDLEQIVEEGESAVAPEVTNGNCELSWDKDFSDVTSDMVVTAQWKKGKMSSADLAEYVKKSTVTVEVKTVHGGSGAGSGFFIDDEGTLVTNYHVIDAASSIKVEVTDGGSYDVSKVVKFDPVYDLAVIQIDLKGNSYLDLSQEEPKVGEQVYAVGSSLGTLKGSFTSGIVSSVSRKVGCAECLQMDAAISSGNSGGPLVNEYGEVVGVNSYSYTKGENLNFAIKVSMLNKLAGKKNWTVNEYVEWYDKETSRSYSSCGSGGKYYYTLVNTYQTVTGRKCVGSYTSEDNYTSGYAEGYLSYFYDYKDSEYDKYVEYLKKIGFEYVSTDGGLIKYHNEMSNIEVDMIITSSRETLIIMVLED